MGIGQASLVVDNQLNKAHGRSVIVYECANQLGGLTVYGVPNMKNTLDVIQRHVDLMVEEGVNFVMNANVGVDSLFFVEKITLKIVFFFWHMVQQNQATLSIFDFNSHFSHRSRGPYCIVSNYFIYINSRGLPMPGRELTRIHVSMEFLHSNTKILWDNGFRDEKFISTKGKGLLSLEEETLELIVYQKP